jgi:hypothetical protein
MHCRWCRFYGLTGTTNLSASGSRLSKFSKLNDNFWLWVQNAGSHYTTTNPYNLPGKNLIEEKEGCDFSGIEKCCRCP